MLSFYGPCFAQENKLPQAQAKTATSPPAQKAMADLKKKELAPAETQKPSGVCSCLKPAIDSIRKAYAALEEDEWPDAIKICKDTIKLITELSKTCSCPQLPFYEKVATAYLKYAEGGDHLDSSEDPDCPYAVGLYSGAIALLKINLSEIKDTTVKQEGENILDYLKEEESFVKDECGNNKVEEKSKGATESKQNKI